MAVRVKGLGGRSGSVDSSRATHTLLYDAWDSSNRWPDIADLYAAVAAVAPAFFNEVPLSSITWDEDDENGHTVFTVLYSSAEAPQSLLTIGFDTTGGTVRARASKSTTSYPVTGRTAPDYKGAIEVADGEPQGVDITIPALKLIFTYKWPKGTFDLAAVRQLARMTGKTNNAPFYGFQQGELLFLGVSGQIDITIPTDVSYNFAASENATLSIGSWITGIAKKGHQHLWVSFEDTEDGAAKKLVQRPLAAYVETVYNEADFSSLGIGT